MGRNGLTISSSSSSEDLRMAALMKKPRSPLGRRTRSKQSLADLAAQPALNPSAEQGEKKRPSLGQLPSSPFKSARRLSMRTAQIGSGSDLLLSMRSVGRQSSADSLHHGTMQAHEAAHIARFKVILASFAVAPDSRVQVDVERIGKYIFECMSQDDELTAVESSLTLDWCCDLVAPLQQEVLLKGTRLYSASERADCAYILLEGQVGTVQGDAKAPVRVESSAYGAIFGTRWMITPEEHHTETVEVVSAKATVLKIPHARYKQVSAMRQMLAALNTPPAQRSKTQIDTVAQHLQRCFEEKESGKGAGKANVLNLGADMQQLCLALSPVLKPRRVRAGEVIFHEGDSGNAHFYIILDGHCAVTQAVGTESDRYGEIGIDWFTEKTDEDGEGQDFTPGADGDREGQGTNADNGSGGAPKLSYKMLERKMWRLMLKIQNERLVAEKAEEKLKALLAAQNKKHDESMQRFLVKKQEKYARKRSGYDVTAEGSGAKEQDLDGSHASAAQPAPLPRRRSMKRQQKRQVTRIGTARGVENQGGFQFTRTANKKKARGVRTVSAPPLQHAESVDPFTEVGEESGPRDRRRSTPSRLNPKYESEIDDLMHGHDEPHMRAILDAGETSSSNGDGSKMNGPDRSRSNAVVRLQATARGRLARRKVSALAKQTEGRKRRAKLGVPDRGDTEDRLILDLETTLAETRSTIVMLEQEMEMLETTLMKILEERDMASLLEAMESDDTMISSRPGKGIVDEDKKPEWKRASTPGYKQRKRHSKQRLLRVLGPGDSFGEVALLRHVKRTATVKAASRGVVLQLAAFDYARIYKLHAMLLVVHTPKAERTDADVLSLGQFLLDVLAPNPCFNSKLTLALTRRFAAACDYQWVPQGDVLFRQGDEGDKFYVVLAGELEVTQRHKNDHIHHRHLLNTKRGSLVCTMNASIAAVHVSDPKKSTAVADVVDSSPSAAAAAVAALDTPEGDGDKDMESVLGNNTGGAPGTEGGSGSENMDNFPGLEANEPKGEVLACLSAGDSFGEIALVERTHRTATVAAMQGTHLLVLSKNDYSATLEQAQEMVIEEKVRFLRQTKLFEACTFAELCRVSFYFVKKIKLRGDMILKQGRQNGKKADGASGTGHHAHGRHHRKSGMANGSAKGTAQKNDSKGGSNGSSSLGGGGGSGGSSSKGAPGKDVHKTQTRSAKAKTGELCHDGTIYFVRKGRVRCVMRCHDRAHVLADPGESDQAHGTEAHRALLSAGSPGTHASKPVMKHAQVAVLGEGQYFGDISALLSVKQPYDVVAASPRVELWCLAVRDLRAAKVSTKAMQASARLKLAWRRRRLTALHKVERRLAADYEAAVMEKTLAQLDMSVSANEISFLEQLQAECRQMEAEVALEESTQLPFEMSLLQDFAKAHARRTREDAAHAAEVEVARQTTLKERETAQAGASAAATRRSRDRPASPLLEVQVAKRGKSAFVPLQQHMMSAGRAAAYRHRSAPLLNSASGSAGVDDEMPTPLLVSPRVNLNVCIDLSIKIPVTESQDAADAQSQDMMWSETQISEADDREGSLQYYYGAHAHDEQRRKGASAEAGEGDDEEGNKDQLWGDNEDTSQVRMGQDRHSLSHAHERSARALALPLGLPSHVRKASLCPELAPANVAEATLRAVPISPKLLMPPTSLSSGPKPPGLHLARIAKAVRGARKIQSSHRRQLDALDVQTRSNVAGAVAEAHLAVDAHEFRRDLQAREKARLQASGVTTPNGVSTSVTGIMPLIEMNQDQQQQQQQQHATVGSFSSSSSSSSSSSGQRRLGPRPATSQGLKGRRGRQRVQHRNWSEEKGPGMPYHHAASSWRCAPEFERMHQTSLAARKRVQQKSPHWRPQSSRARAGGTSQPSGDFLLRPSTAGVSFLAASFVPELEKRQRRAQRRAGAGAAAGRRAVPLPGLGPATPGVRAGGEKQGATSRSTPGQSRRMTEAGKSTQMMLLAHRARRAIKLSRTVAALKRSRTEPSASAAPASASGGDLAEEEKRMAAEVTRQRRILRRTASLFTQVNSRLSDAASDATDVQRRVRLLTARRRMLKATRKAAMVKKTRSMQPKTGRQGLPGVGVMTSTPPGLL